MPVVDVHAHIYPDKVAEKASQSIGNFYHIPMEEQDGSVWRLLNEIDGSDITRCVVHSVAVRPGTVESINDFISATCKEHQEFVGFMTLHQDTPNIEAEIERACGLGLHGIKLHPDTQAVNMDDDRLMPVYEIAERRGLPLIIHCGDYRYDYSHPRRLKRILHEFPQLVVDAAHFGGWSIQGAGGNLRLRSHPLWVRLPHVAADKRAEDIPRRGVLPGCVGSHVLVQYRTVLGDGFVEEPRIVMERSAMATTDVRRDGGRAVDELRLVRLTREVQMHAAGSCMAEFGNTRVLCAATVEEGVPRWRKGSHAGWVTAEYAMLPASTNRRSPREQRGRKGRSMEIERLIGRSLRTVVDLRALGEITVTLDCDVIQADGGTRTASVTGAWVALHDALAGLVREKKLSSLPLMGQVAAVSMGVVNGVAMLDLDYGEDSNAEVDMNLVGTADGRIIELQGTGEKTPYDRAQLDALLDLGETGVDKLIALQRKVTGFGV